VTPSQRLGHELPPCSTRRTKDQDAHANSLTEPSNVSADRHAPLVARVRLSALSGRGLISLCPM
jgi:hypothetical protein